jgi:hypothetical protein
LYPPALNFGFARPLSGVRRQLPYMNFVEIQIPAEKAYCLPIGDIHWGDKAFKKVGKDKLKGNLDWLMEHRDHAFGVLMGDIYNVAGRNEKTSPFESDPNEYEEAADFFQPYGEVLKGAISGNHENRIQNNYGLNPLKAFCRHVGIPFLGSSALLRIQVGLRPQSLDGGTQWYHNAYYMAIHHTTGGGGTIGNALNSPAKLEKVIAGCDVYAGGHNHQLVTGVRQTFVPTVNGPRMKKVYYVSCGAYLEYEDSYAETAMYSPGKLGSPRIRFSGVRDHHDVHISL